MDVLFIYHRMEGMGCFFIIISQLSSLGMVVRQHGLVCDRYSPHPLNSDESVPSNPWLPH